MTPTLAGKVAFDRGSSAGRGIAVQPDAWRYVVEVQDAGKPADVTGRR